MSPAIEIDRLTKAFQVRASRPGLAGALKGLVRPTVRDVVAVDRISFAIEAGERVAFVGPNGAGKSTTLKMLTGILYPTSGEAHVLGHVPWRERRRLAYRIGTVFGQRTQLWYHLPAVDSLDLLARIYDQAGGRYRRRRAELEEAFGLGPLLATPVRQLSLGQRMRCEIVASLLHGPDVLLLDEPTIGLDVTARATIRDLVRDTAIRHGSTILLTSHDTGDIEKVCDRVIVIHRGGLLLDRPLADLRTRYIRKKRVTLLTVEPSVAVDLPGVRRLEASPHRTVLEVDVQATAVEAVVARALQVAHVRDLTVEDPPMDDIIRAIYARAEATT